MTEKVIRFPLQKMVSFITGTADHFIGADHLRLMIDAADLRDSRIGGRMRQAQKRNLPGGKKPSAAPDQQIHDAPLFGRQIQRDSPEQNLCTGKPETASVHIAEIRTEAFPKGTVYSGDRRNILRTGKIFLRRDLLKPGRSGSGKFRFHRNKRQTMQKCGLRLPMQHHGTGNLLSPELCPQCFAPLTAGTRAKSNHRSAVLFSAAISFSRDKRLRT